MRRATSKQRDSSPAGQRAEEEKKAAEEAKKAEEGAQGDIAAALAEAVNRMLDAMVLPIVGRASRPQPVFMRKVKGRA